MSDPKENREPTAAEETPAEKIQEETDTEEKTADAPSE